MASRQVRNLINNQIDSVVARAETEVRNEAKKKLIELKQKVSSPEEIIKMLETTISEEGCSPKAIEKFYTVHDQIMSKLTNIEGILTVGLDKLTLIEEKINPIINGEGPVSKINGIVEFLQPITNTLKGIIALAPILLAANSGPTSSGAITDQVSTKKNKAAFVFCIFYTSKTIHSKNAQNQRIKLMIFSQQKIKILLFNVGLFQQVLLI